MEIMMMSRNLDGNTAGLGDSGIAGDKLEVIEEDCWHRLDTSIGKQAMWQGKCRGDDCWKRQGQK